jgi:V/A-type H+/Na+-transporting ATPase subunit I
MIVPMTKYGFLVYHRDFDFFLSKLQELGVVDIIKQIHTPTEKERGMLGLVNRYTAAINALSSKIDPNISAGEAIAEEIVGEIENLQKEQEQIEVSIRKAQKDLADARPWGEFNPDTIKEIENKGIEMRFLIASDKVFSEEWLKENFAEIILNQWGNVYFVLLQKDEIIEIPFEVQEVKLPSFSFQQKEMEIEEFKQRLNSIENRFIELAQLIPTMEKAKGEIVNKLEFIAVQTSADRQAEDTLMILQGWIPDSKNESLVEFLESENIAFVSEKAKVDDDVPILLKNNRFSKLFEPIGEFYELPNYKEMDLVPFFAPFYMMFFGFCLGDAGYGLFIVLMAGIIKLKMPQYKPILSLAQYLGLSTVIFGMLTGTIFGINLIESEIPWLQNVKGFMINPSQLFNLALILGVVQIIFGMVVKVVNTSIQFGFRYAFSTVGWLLLIIGGGAIYGLNSAEIITAQVYSISLYSLLAISGILILILNNPKRNIFINFGAGLWDTYGMLTGLLGDLLSYLRLFALGVSSAILGMVFNSMAMNMKPDNVILGPIVMIIILVFGHGITLFMAALGAFVHPIRLTFVEFYKNAGFTGGGKKYEPFKKFS